MGEYARARRRFVERRSPAGIRDPSVLEAGTGSGYPAAILSKRVSRIVSIERIPRPAASAHKPDGSNERL